MKSQLWLDIASANSLSSVTAIVFDSGKAIAIWSLDANTTSGKSTINPFNFGFSDFRKDKKPPLPAPISKYVTLEVEETFRRCFSIL